MSLTEKQRDVRNLNPHAEAILAMNLWNDEYAFKQRGGVMDFWDAIGDSRRQRCRELVERIKSTKSEDRPLVKMSRPSHEGGK